MKPCFAIFTLATAQLCAAELPPSLHTFLENRCFDCHDSETKKGELDLTALKFDPADKANLDRWVRVHDKVENGDMPPKKKTQPEAKERAAFLTTLAQPLMTADKARQAQKGRGVVRRLNRVEFETALSDLLGLPLRIQEQLPTDGKGSGFDTVGAALNVSSVQMESYLAALDMALDQATTLYEKPERRTWRLSYKDTEGMMGEYRRSNAFNIEPDGVAFLGPEFHSYLNSLLDHFTVPYAAKYRVKVSAYAVRTDAPLLFTIRTGGSGHQEREDVPKTLLGHVSVKPGAPQVFEFEPHLERGQFFRMYPATLPVIRFDIPKLAGTQKNYTGPGVVVQWVEVEGPIFDQWPPASHERLWSGVKSEPLRDVKKNIDPNAQLKQPPKRTAQPRMTQLPGGGGWKYDPKQGVGGERIYSRAKTPDPLHNTLRLVSPNAKADAERLLSEFVPLAFRRPVAEAETQRFVTLVQRWLDEGDDFETAMRAGYKAVLTSPGFLYHQGTLPAAENTMRLDDHALAERLSFFLWNSLPDAELRRLADAGKLSDAATLRAQTERMLADAKQQRFLTSFLGQWLELRNLDFTTPDSALYPEHDPVLQWSIGAETHAFFNELLTHDLSVRNVVHSDFAMLNSRLAKHYGIVGADDMTMRKVKLPPDSPRGGVLTQASVLKVTANGTSTSPVVRGAWVLDRIMGKPADPPPPGVPAIEPDIRGAVTVRQQLEKHRNAATCAACHAKMDPPGVALESFDVIGLWRDVYRVLDPSKADLKVIGHPGDIVPIKYNPGLPVDASDKLADGRAFTDIRGFKQLLLSDPDQIARTVASKLAIYATGAPITFSDRPEIDSIIATTRAKDHGFRSLIHAVIQSPFFHSK